MNKKPKRCFKCYSEGKTDCPHIGADWKDKIKKVVITARDLITKHG